MIERHPGQASPPHGAFPPPLPRSPMSCPTLSLVARFTRTALAAGCLLAFAAPAARAQTWIGMSGTGDNGSWATAGHWQGGVRPDAAGAAVTFNSPPATRSVTVDSGATGFSVGSITFTNNSTFSSTLTVGTTGSNLKL